VSLPLTQGLAHFVASRTRTVPPDLVPVLRNAFIDTIGCLLSGRDEAVTAAALAFGRARGGAAAQASVLLAPERLSAQDAAFVNAVAGHALDYDDTGINGHPSVVLVPALLASAESRGCSDAALFAAYLTGYEAWAGLAAREADKLHGKGWHPTGVLGTVAVAAAVAHLEQLTAQQAAHALGIAASLAGGLMGNFGSMTKPLHAGWAARHGLEAVALARLGVTACDDVLESSNGFLAAFSPAGRVDLGPWTEPGEPRLRTGGLSIKKYPVGFASHKIIDAVIMLRNAHGLRPEQVRGIEAHARCAA
jgi:aconitate decarboxylase